jgi:hypothetical protein
MPRGGAAGGPQRAAAAARHDAVAEKETVPDSVQDARLATRNRAGHIRKELGMTDTNYLRDSLKAAGAEQVSTCKLCGALVNSSWLDTHGHVHQADHEPVLFDTHSLEVSTCKLCGILANGSYQRVHNQVHHADYEQFATASPGAAETCTVCGALVNSSYQEAHNRRGHG